ncbi:MULTISPECIES: LysR family transcriptional regulator [unclassified Beijerinckia]|uniref:LysR family transcriptional regulator n=1 Tax=unclassified Beijerinckia TaxID=2638183 RepID=UPI00089465D5|nr:MULTISPECIES: LysR family transcriptional regulator [unclassified Beijerinckia]MDH7798350.1 LysR family transcriptional regulator for bpeEF and oprC [Beijerinckia sp. GAS462]SED17996.1 DNA-binding transcriptional regulator, LysR family [Beijerinckia sp. 28-YEA-48]
MTVTAPLRDLKKLNTFVRVAERRSFTKAAEDLRTTPSVVSKHMKELEETLGFSLLNRSTHGIVLTDAGEGLFQNCLHMLASLDDYLVEARNSQTGPFGTLRVQTTSDYARLVLSPLIGAFADRHPGLRVHLAVVPEDQTPSEDGCDVIVAGRKPSLPGLLERDLGPVPHVICAAPAYFARCGRPQDPQDLRQHNCLVNLYGGPKSWPFQAASRPLLIEVKGSLSSNNTAALIQMALQGWGIIRVPLSAVQAELAEMRLETILDQVALSPERISLYFSKAKHLPAKTSDFIQFLLAAMAEKGPGKATELIE